MTPSSPLANATTTTTTADDFQQLEQRVLRAVEVVRREREGRLAAEAELTRLRQRTAEQATEIERLEQEHGDQQRAHEAARAELLTLQDERAAVRERIERMLHQMDELL